MMKRLAVAGPVAWLNRAKSASLASLPASSEGWSRPEKKRPATPSMSFSSLRSRLLATFTSGEIRERFDGGGFRRPSGSDQGRHWLFVECARVRPGGVSLHGRSRQLVECARVRPGGVLLHGRRLDSATDPSFRNEVPRGTLFFSSGEWRNWQTRRIQVPVIARSWGFKSPLAHQGFRPLRGLCPGVEKPSIATRLQPFQSHECSIRVV